MSLLMSLFSYFVFGGLLGEDFTALELANAFYNSLDELGVKLNLVTSAIAIAVIAVAALFGLFGYRFIRPVMGLVMGGAGFFVGYDLCSTLDLGVEFPAWCAYVFGIVLALILFSLAFAKPTYAWFFILFLVGSGLFRYLPIKPEAATERVIYGFAAGILFAILGMFFFRLFYIFVSSYGMGYVVIFLLSKLLPDVTFLQLGGDSYIPFIIVCVLSLLFVIVQYLTAPRRKKR